MQRDKSVLELELKELRDLFDQELAEYPKFKDSLAEEQGKCQKLQAAYDSTQLALEAL